MNEKLREIAIKAQVEHCVSHVRLEEFATLIIEECISGLDYYDGAYHHSVVLKQQFGIEQ